MTATWQVDLAVSYEEAVKLIRASNHRIAVLDLSLGGPDHRNQDGLKVLEAINRMDPDCISIFLTGFATVELAVSLIHELGAYTCLRKETFRRADFRKVINDAMISFPLHSGEPHGGSFARTTGRGRRNQSAGQRRHSRQRPGD